MEYFTNLCQNAGDSLTVADCFLWKKKYHLASLPPLHLIGLGHQDAFIME